MAAEETPAGDKDTPLEGTDPETGKLLHIPRPALVVDDSDPSVLKIAFSGSVEIERGDARWVEFYNSLKAGKDVSLEVGAFVSGPKKTHRRDSDGNVDAVVETKSVTITDVIWKGKE